MHLWFYVQCFWWTLLFITEKPQCGAGSHHHLPPHSDPAPAPLLRSARPACLCPEPLLPPIGPLQLHMSHLWTDRDWRRPCSAGSMGDMHSRLQGAEGLLQCLLLFRNRNLYSKALKMILFFSHKRSDKLIFKKEMPLSMCIVV